MSGGYSKAVRSVRVTVVTGFASLLCSKNICLNVAQRVAERPVWFIERVASLILCRLIHCV